MSSYPQHLTLAQRQHLLKLRNPKTYTYWEANPNTWRPGSYCLRIDWCRSNARGQVSTYFYPGQTGHELVDVVRKQMNEIEQKDTATEGASHG
ncbi:hypothetical protein [Pseudomonas sp. QD4]|uniref:hypothetical protein n=1 Tax=Pseudomonas sp. QD4 TaxID=3368618 RepID=UPI003BA28809